MAEGMAAEEEGRAVGHTASAARGKEREQRVAVVNTSRPVPQEPISSRKAPLHKLLQLSKAVLPAGDQMSQHMSL